MNQVSALDRLRAKAQVRHSHGAGLLRVVNEITLRVIRRLFADDLDRVLVRADRAVGAQTPEQCAHLVLRISVVKFGSKGQAVEGDIIDDADGEMILRSRPSTFRRRRS